MIRALRWLSVRAADRPKKLGMNAIAVAGIVLAVGSQGAVAQGAVAQGAVADVFDECRQGGPEVLSACTAVITGPSFDPEQKLLAYMIRGTSRVNAGFNRLAIADFSEVIRLNKNDAITFADRGRAKLADGDLPGSIADFSSAIALSGSAPNTQRSQLYVQRGHARIVNKQPNDAIGDLDEAIRLNNANANAWNTRGVAYVRKQDFGRAIGDYTAAIAILPSPVIHMNRGYAYERQSLAQQAIADFRIALGGDPSLVEAKDALNRHGVPVDAASETNQRVRKGAALAETSCSGCHSVGSTGDSPQKSSTEFRNYYKKQPLLALKPSVARAMREIHYETNGSNINPARELISDIEIDQVVAHINSLSTEARLGLSR